MNNQVNIRLATAADAPAILEIYRPYIENTAVTFEESVPGVPEFQQRMHDILVECPFLVCEIDQTITGYAYAGPYRARASYRWNKEVSVYIHSGFHRRNIAVALYTALFKIMKRQHYANLLAVITLPNKASVSLHESLGFKPCGVFNKVGYKLEKWHAVGWWELALPEAERNDPREPVLFQEIRQTHQFDEIFRQAAGLVKIF